MAGEPASLHYRAVYLAAGAPHQLEVWRDGDRRLRRVTDRRTTTLISHVPGNAEFGMTVVDPVKRVVTTINRTNLYRLGNFTDWFDLGHGLRHPKGTYRLLAAAAPKQGSPAIAACGWYDLVASARTTSVCWSRDLRLPLVIVAGGKTVWRIASVDRVVPGDVFSVPSRGFVRVDANRDLDKD